MDNNIIIIVSVILSLLLFLSMFFSSTETAMFSINRYRLKDLARKRVTYARVTLKMLQTPSRLLGTILIGNNFINIAASAIATRLGYEIYGDTGILISTISLTVVILLFGEIFPKTLATQYPEKIIRMSCYVMYALTKILLPLLVLTDKTTALIIKLFGSNENIDSKKQFSVSELKMVLHDSSTQIPTGYKEMLLSILDLEERDIEDIIIETKNIIGINLDAPIEKSREVLLKYQFEYMPVYHRDINGTEGFLYIKDAINFFLLTDKKEQTITNLKKILKPPIFIPETSDLFKQLTNFVSKHNTPVAMVVDEYGDVQGMITINLILQQIIGHLNTIATQSSAGYQENENTYILYGKSAIHDVNKRFDLELRAKNAKTINGLIMEVVETFPKGNFGFRRHGYQFETLAIRHNAVYKLRIKKISATDAESEN